MKAITPARRMSSPSVVARIAVAAMAACVLMAPAASAAPCDGFTDVDDTSPFCPTVEWLRNRQITTGCTATEYCPANSVTRLQMAAFMTRLGKALSPAFFSDMAGGASLNLASPPPTVCETNQISLAEYPRSAHAGAVLTGAVTADTTVRLTIVGSSDGGTNWTPLSTAPSTASETSGWVNLTAWKANIPIAAGATLLVGLRVDSPAPGAPSLSDWICQLEVAVYSRSGGSSPY